MTMAGLCTIKFIVALLPFCPAPAPVAVGYVEGEYVQMAPIDVAQIREIKVKRGDAVKAGDTIALMEQSDARYALLDATGRKVQTEADLANLRRGRRPEEIAVIEATLASAVAQAGDAERSLKRRQDLFSKGVSSQAEFDQAVTANDVAQAHVGEVRANLAVARLPARDEEIRSAENRLKSAEANLAQAEWKLAQRVLIAPQTGHVTDVVRRVGELAGPNAPIVTLLPDGAVKLKVYVPEQVVSLAKVGQRLDVRCDKCRAGLFARVSYVSREPEFTPPVIYSLETRQKLVYLIEARPEDASAAALQPGQIVDVTFGGDAP
jgi:HlyD family secretion protein